MPPPRHPRQPRPWTDSLVHLRPRSWGVVFAHYMSGAMIALAHDRNPTGSGLSWAIIGGVVWAALLNGGGLALNTAFEKWPDPNSLEGEGRDPYLDSPQTAGGLDLGYRAAPPPVPKGLVGLALSAIGVGLGMAFIMAFGIGSGFFTAYLIVGVLALLYAVPPIRLKTVPGADLLINMVAYGAMTFAAGALASGVGSGRVAADGGPGFSPGTGAAITWLAVGFGFLYGAFYPMTQIHQITRARARGERSLFVILGPRVSLSVAIALVALCGVAQGIAAYQLSLKWWAWVALLGSSGAWIAFTIDWLWRSEGYPSLRGMYRALRLWALSDIVVILTFVYGTRAWNP